MTVDLVRELLTTVSRQATTVPYGDGELLTLPWSLGDGESVSIYVEQLEDQLYLISDRGLAADSLALAGVDLKRSAVRASWNAVLRDVNLAPSALSARHAFEIAYTTPPDRLGTALTALGEAVLRADGLRALSLTRPTRAFREAVIQSASRHSKAVVPHAPLPMRFGGKRTVTCRLDGAHPTWVQALAASGGSNENYDHVRSLLSDALVSKPELVVVVADAASLDDWQTSALAERSQVVRESDQDDFFAKLAA